MSEKTNFQARHGDVLVEKIDNKEVPKNFKEAEATLAEGEVTGHSHLVFGDQVQYFRTESTAVPGMNSDGVIGKLLIGGGIKATQPILRHVDRTNNDTGEHNAIVMPEGEGSYNVILQREFDPEALRRAAD